MTSTMFKIVTDGQGKHDWVVKTQWHGAERVVYSGSVYACCKFVTNHKEK